MTIRVCDRCKQEFKDEFSFSTLSREPYLIKCSWQDMKGFTGSRTIDLCRECFQSFMKYKDEVEPTREKE